jgi:hypothetical protein
VASLEGLGILPCLSDVDQLFDGWLRSIKYVFASLFFSLRFFGFPTSSWFFWGEVGVVIFLTTVA